MIYFWQIKTVFVAKMYKNNSLCGQELKETLLSWNPPILGIPSAPFKYALRIVLMCENIWKSMDTLIFHFIYRHQVLLFEIQEKYFTNIQHNMGSNDLNLSAFAYFRFTIWSHVTTKAARETVFWTLQPIEQLIHD